MKRNMIDAASREALGNKTSHEARDLIVSMVANSQQFGIHGNPQAKLNKVKAYGICFLVGHLTDTCRTL